MKLAKLSHHNFAAFEDARADVTAKQAAFIDLVESACRETGTLFKKPGDWGVTQASDPRAAMFRFGEFKTAMRLETEAKLCQFMEQPSDLVAVAIGAPGAGKTRLFDDAMRVPLDTTRILRLYVVFNGRTGGTFKHPLATRVLREFFCGPPSDMATAAMSAIDKKLACMFPQESVIDKKLACMFPDNDAADVAATVLAAVEALYFEQRGALGRSVLLIDEIAQARKWVTKVLDEFNTKTTSDACEAEVFAALAAFIDAGRAPNQGSRHGVALTSLGLFPDWSPTTVAGRSVLWLPLDTFDVWDGAVQSAVTLEAQTLWPGLVELPQGVWPLLAGTGGRPRDVFNMLHRLSIARPSLGRPIAHDLLCALFETNGDPTFRHYLLPSLLGLKFQVTFVKDGERCFTVFARQASSAALLNYTHVAQADAAVPAVALGHAQCLHREDGDAVLHDTIRLLIASTACLDGDCFARTWALLTFSVLLLQHLVRSEFGLMWWPPRPEHETVLEFGGPSRPTATEIDVFAGENRVEALFAKPTVAPGSSINHKIDTEVRPTLALWKNLWAAEVEAGDAQASGWPATCDVQWRPSTVVFFTDDGNIDFALLVGKAGGKGEAEPRVFVFQSELPPGGLVAALGTLATQLEHLLSPELAQTHVLRRAGINRREQVTLCVAAMSDVEQEVPCNVVLFGADEFRALGGETFKRSALFRKTLFKHV